MEFRRPDGRADLVKLIPAPVELCERTPEIDASTLPEDWADVLHKHQYDLSHLDALVAGIYNDAPSGSVLPKRSDVFRAFHLVRPVNVRVVILGQDPYAKPEQHAHGLAFSVPEDVRFPRSLNAIFRNLEADEDVDFSGPKAGDLTGWAQQGVLLLNTALTVKVGVAGSHARLWRDFTDRVLRVINEECDHVAFLLWGSHAIDRADSIEIKERHAVFRTAHPTARGWTKQPWFMESRPFFEANSYLTNQSPHLPITRDLATKV